VLALAVACSVGRASADQTTQLLVDAAHAGNAGASTLAPPLSVLWSRNLSAGSPLVVGGRVFVAVSQPVSSGASPVTLTALDDNTGATLWSAPLGQPSDRVFLAYDGGRVFTAQELGPGGILVRAFAADSGAPVWSSEQSDLYALSYPLVVAEGDVLVEGDDARATLGGNSAVGRALQESSGATLWSRLPLEGDLAALGSSVYLASGCSAGALDPASGRLRWFYQATGCAGTGAIGHPPEISRGGIWTDLGDTKGSSELSLQGRRLLWTGFAATNGVAFSGDTAVLSEGIGLHARSQSTHRALWDVPQPPQGFFDGPPLIAGGYVFTTFLTLSGGSQGDRLEMIDLSTGAIDWTSTDATLPFQTNGHGFQLGAGDGELVATGDGTITSLSSASRPSAAVQGYGCIVPSLLGRSRRALARALAGSGCRLGRVNVSHLHHGRLIVVRQSPPAGSALPANTAVNVRLGARARR
jgi:outer membrane protein assembly factor BamB